MMSRYTLLGGQHVFDFLQAALLWSPAAWLLLSLSRRVGDTQSDAAIVAGTTLALYVALFFMVNPLLGMEMEHHGDNT